MSISRLSASLRFFYRQLQHETSSDLTAIIASISEKLHSKASISKCRLLLYAYFIFSYLRFLLIWYILLSKQYLGYFQVDLVAGITVATSATMNNPNAVLCTAQINLIILYFDYLLYGRPDTYIWPLVADWMLVNHRHFFNLNSGIFKPELAFLKPWKSYLSYRFAFGQIITSKRLIFDCPKLPNYRPSVCAVIRANSVIIRERFQFTFSRVLRFFKFFAVFSTFTYTIRLYRHYQPSLFLLPLFLLDLILGFLRFFHLIRLGCFFLYAKLLLAYVECAHLAKLNQMLRQLSTEYVPEYNFWYIFRVFRREQTAIGVDIQKANHRLVSRLLFTAGLASVAYNMVILSILVFHDYPLGIKLRGFILIATQALLGFSILRPLIRPALLYHASGKTLLKLQLASFRKAATAPEKVEYLKNKLKLMTACELVHTDGKLYFTAGPMGEVSYTQAGNVRTLWRDN